jgi:hypothetical protein
MQGTVVLQPEVAAEPVNDKRMVKIGDAHWLGMKMLDKETARFCGPPFVPKTGSKHLTIS